MNPALAAAGIAAILAAVQLLLQKYSPVYALLLSVGAAAFLLLWLLPEVSTLLQGVSELARQVDGQAFSCLLRCAGILLLTDYARTLCEEAGADSLGWCTGFAGRCFVLAAAFPLLQEVCQKVWGLAG